MDIKIDVQKIDVQIAPGEPDFQILVESGGEITVEVEAGTVYELPAPPYDPGNLAAIFDSA